MNVSLPWAVQYNNDASAFGGKAPFRKLGVLIIDDDSRNIFALSAVLKAKGFKTLSASNMVEAFGILEKAELQTPPENDPQTTGGEAPFDKLGVGTILLDMMMPGMDGYEAAATLKRDERYRSIPLIAVTAQAMAGDKERILAAGADAYLSKPVDVDALLQLLNNYLK